MACYAAVAPLLELLGDVLHRNRYPNYFLRGQQHILESLHEKFSSLLEFLEKGVHSSPQGDKDGMEVRIRDVAYRGQDIIESQLRWEEEEDSELHDLLQQVDCIMQTALETQKRHDSGVMSGFGPVPAFQPSSQYGPDVDPMFGYDDEIMRIKEHLLYEDPGRQVIAIVGMGGIGKTTLTRTIFEDEFVVEYFDRRVWITASQNYNSKNIARSILISLQLTTPETLSRDDEDEWSMVHFYLLGRRYLIVIDDVWDTQVWNDVKKICPDNYIKQRIIITTRLSNVALDASFIHEKKFLNEDESWKLLHHEVFRGLSCPIELEDFGRCIASKCGGLPLAIFKIANLLANNTLRTPNQWEIISLNFDSALLTDDLDLSNSIFSPSYNSLPHHLKVCLLYIGSYSQDCEIIVSKLIKVLIAEGFFQSIDGPKTLEDVARESIMDLIGRHLILTTNKTTNGDVKNCIMHKVLRVFCRKRASDEGFFQVELKNWHWHSHQISDVIENVRCITLLPSLPPQPHSYNVSKFVHSILPSGNTSMSNFSDTDWDKLKLLRVLRILVKTLPILNAIFQMFRLKYLELGVTQCIHLPPSLSRLQNLQTLIIYNPFSYTITLPPEIWKMMQLRHLILGEVVLPSVPMVSGIPIQKLEHLQTLKTVEDFIFTDEAIETITNLRKLKMCCKRNEEGSLCDSYCLADLWDSYRLDNLVHLHQLEELNINVAEEILTSYIKSVWSSVVFPLSLRKLSLQGCKFSRDEMRVVGLIPNLQVLKLKEDSFTGEEWVILDDEFLQLKFLLLERLDLSRWTPDYTFFPRLEYLRFSVCTKLETIPWEIGEFPLLKVIDVYQSSRNARASAKRFIDYLKTHGNEKLTVLVRD